MPDTRYFFACAHEQFPPEDLVAQAVEAEQQGFDGIGCSDHFQPWWEPGESGQAWVWLGAVGQATQKVPIGTAVTPPSGARYHPALVAQAFATLERQNPGRVFIGLGSGESMNESPLGMDWPPVSEQLDRFEEALEMMHRLYDGERVDSGRHFGAKRAYLRTRPERRPPFYVSGFGTRAAAIAGRLGDGLWTLADPEEAPPIIEAYRAACDDAGREPGEILLHAGFSWAEDDDAAFEGARVWKAAFVDEFYTDDWHDPVKMQEHAQEKISDDELREGFLIGSDTEQMADRIREIEDLGATIVVLMNISGSDPHGAIRAYGERVLPSLRGVAARS
jgi:coenzyme F420-dependent glucose-6-phosphate dehydrogenase